MPASPAHAFCVAETDVCEQVFLDGPAPMVRSDFSSSRRPRPVVVHVLVAVNSPQRRGAMRSRVRLSAMTLPKTPRQHGAQYTASRYRSAGTPGTRNRKTARPSER
jgi:hypothetical protein